MSSFEHKSLCCRADLIFVKMEDGTSYANYIEIELTKCSKCGREHRIPHTNRIKQLQENIKEIEKNA